MEDKDEDFDEKKEIQPVEKEDQYEEVKPLTGSDWQAKLEAEFDAEQDPEAGNPLEERLKSKT